jgi:hypothetical protein
VVWSVSTGPAPVAELLFLKGDEDPDHMVAEVELDTGATDFNGRWGAANDLLERATIEQMADIKSRAKPVRR